MGRKSAGFLFIAWLATAGAAFALTGQELASEFERGLKAYDAHDYPTAFKIWWEIRDQDLAAMRNVALMLRKGDGVPKDPRKAESVLKTASHAGLMNANVDLAEMYLNGELGEPAPKRAVPLLREAAEAGHPLAQYLLAQMYEYGNGVDRDMNRAAQLYMAAAQSGLREAKLRLASLGTATPAKPAAAPKPGPVAQTPPPVSEADYVQLGAFKSQTIAQSQWAVFATRPELRQTTHKIERADLGRRGIWYRILVAQSGKSASNLCATLKATGTDCFVRP